jgi:hypothetical protein
MKGREWGLEYQRLEVGDWRFETRGSDEIQLEYAVRIPICLLHLEEAWHQWIKQRKR